MFLEDILPIDGTADRADLFGQPERLLDVTGSSKCEEAGGCQCADARYVPRTSHFHVLCALFSMIANT